jgi:hypothetical protein
LSHARARGRGEVTAIDSTTGPRNARLHQLLRPGFTVRPSSGPAGATARQRLARGLGTSGQRLRIGAPRRITLVTLLVAGVGAAA